MNIAYVAVGFEMDKRLGVLGKIQRQISHWVEAGHDVRFFVQSHRPPCGVRDGMTGGVPVEVFTHGSIRGVGLLGGLLQRFAVVSALVERVESWGADLVYVRFNTWYPALTALAGRVPLVLEVNTDDLREYRLMMSRLQYAYHRLGRGRLMRRAAGLVFVTHELASNRSFARLRRPQRVIPNGIRLQDYPVLPPTNNDRPRLVFIGSAGHPWHGVDKIVRLAGYVPEWHFDLIGLGPEDLGGHAPPNVVCHGYLDRSGYDRIMALADVAIGTLALHRKGMSEAAPLKVREYLAYGIPTIVGYRDSDFLDGCEYLLELPNTEDNVESHLGEIRAFVERMRGIRVPREAVAHIDDARKETARLEFFAEVVRHSGLVGALDRL